MRLLIESFVRSIKFHKIIIFFLLLGIIASSFSFSVLLGYGRHRYYDALKSNTYTSLTLYFTSKKLEKEETETYIIAPYENKATSILLMAEKGDKIIIGWKGTQQNKWFPAADGRFFTEKEFSDGSYVAYVNDIEDKEQISEILTVDGKNYTIVGTGWVNPIAFARAAFAEKPHAAFGILPNENREIIIIPYTTFLDSYSPDTIVLDMSSGRGEFVPELSALSNVAKSIKENIPYITHVSLPVADSDEKKEEERKTFTSLGLLLSVLISFTIVSLFLEWFKMNKRQYQIYMICGLTRIKILILLFSEWFIYVIIGCFFGFFIHWLSVPFLGFFNIGYLPEMREMITVITAIFFVTSLFSLPHVIKLIKGGTKKGAE